MNTLEIIRQKQLRAQIIELKKTRDLKFQSFFFKKS